MVLHCKDICKAYGEVEVLKEISLHVNKGEIVTLLGPSGCGKSTLLRVISGLESCECGDIFINNKQVAGGKKELPPQKRGVAFVFQDYALLPHMDVKENILFGLHGMSRPLQLERLHEVSTLLGMETLLKRYPHELSGGQQQRVSLARALAGHPDLILFDEPFSNLDTALKESLRTELKRLIKRLNIGAIFVTHDQKEALSMSDRVALMRGGKIEQCDAPKRIYEAPVSKYAALFMGRVSFLEAATIGLAINDSALSLAIRPEHCHWSQEEGELKGTVEEVHYLGEHQIIKVQLTSSEETVLIRVDGMFEVLVGDTGYVTIDKEKVMWLTT